ncbi:MAG: hypothetical protein JWM80_1696 [Cyanobacteria bacterium RYN_339]|nr:hypothetical protein [Cyanobacteria bacterium RYN_339]
MASLRDVGQSLKEAREAQGQTLDEISVRTRITVRHLIALEEGNESDLPEVFYVRGFLKKYAESVGLSPKEVADAYRAAPIPTTTPPSIGASAGPIVYYVLVAGLVGGILALAWHFQPKQVVVSEPSPSPKVHRATPTPKPAVDAGATAAAGASGAAIAEHAGTNAAKPSAKPSGSTKPSANPSGKPSAGPSAKPSASPSAKPSGSPSPGASASPSAKPSASPSAKPTAYPSGTVTLDLTTDQKSWLEIRVDGKAVFEGLLPPNSHKSFKGHQIMVSAGNAGGVRIKINGQDKGHLGPHGEVVAKTFKP